VFPKSAGSEGGGIEKFDTKSDVPKGIEEGDIVYIRDENSHFFEDGT